MNLDFPERLIVFAKQPLPGYAKSRLGRALGDEQSAGIYSRLLYAYLLDLIGGLGGHCQVELSLAADEDIPFFQEAFPEFLVRSQAPGNLGARMDSAIRRAFHEGIQRVVLTGSDIPGLNSNLVQEAFIRLEEDQVVLGPAVDGGYFLVGLTGPEPSLFEDIPWSTDQVLERTIQRAERAGLTWNLLPEMEDIDNLEAFNRWRRVQLLRQEESP